jgi:oxygen-dependent protoporphyrinogen oxidase
VTTFVVIGGGVSGLAAARILAGCKPVSEAGGTGLGGDAEVLLLESSDRVGGKLLTGMFGAAPVELGPDQFLRRDPSAENLCRHFGLGDDLIAPAVRSAAVYANGRPRGLPAGLMLGVPTNLDALADSGIVGDEALEFARSESERPGPVLSAADVGLDELADPAAELSAGYLLRQRLGDEIVDRLADPLIGGINAGRLDELSLGTVAPQIARALVGHHDVMGPLAAAMARPGMRPAGAAGGEGAAALPPESPFFGLAGGLGRLLPPLKAELREAGCDVRLSCPVLGATRQGTQFVLSTPEGEIDADGIVLALPGPEIEQVLGSIGGAVVQGFADIAYASVAVVTFAFAPGTDAAGTDARLEGWSGVLVPRVQGALMTAATFLSAKWPWMTAGADAAPGPLVRVSAGRFGDDRIAALSDSEIIRRLLGELPVYTGMPKVPVDFHLHRWDQAFPQYAPGYLSRLTNMRRAVAGLGGVALAGAVLGGIGLPACISSGERAALELASSMR